MRLLALTWLVVGLLATACASPTPTGKALPPLFPTARASSISSAEAIAAVKSWVIGIPDPSGQLRVMQDWLKGGRELSESARWNGFDGRWEVVLEGRLFWYYERTGSVDFRGYASSSSIYTYSVRATATPLPTATPRPTPTPTQTVQQTLQHLVNYFMACVSRMGDNREGTTEFVMSWPYQAEYKWGFGYPPERWYVRGPGMIRLPSGGRAVETAPGEWLVYGDTGSRDGVRPLDPYSSVFDEYLRTMAQRPGGRLPSSCWDAD